MGAAGFGGDTTALIVRVETAPCHIAALPVAINLGCSAMRRCTVELPPQEIDTLQQLEALMTLASENEQGACHE